MKSVEELHVNVRNSNGSNIYRCYNNSNNRVEFHCKDCIVFLPPSTKVEGNPQANMFVKCETCGYQYRDWFLRFFINWFLFFIFVGFVPPTYIHENLEIDILFGKHTMFWSFLSLWFAFGGGLIFILVRNFKNWHKQ